MKQTQKIRSSIGQVDSVITFDLAISTKAKQVQSRCPEDFFDTVIHMEGFNITVYTELLVTDWKEVHQIWAR